MKIMVAYDGTLQAKDALVYGMDKAREKGHSALPAAVYVHYQEVSEGSGSVRPRQGSRGTRSGCFDRSRKDGLKMSADA